MRFSKTVFYFFNQDSYAKRIALLFIFSNLFYFSCVYLGVVIFPFLILLYIWSSFIVDLDD